MPHATKVKEMKRIKITKKVAAMVVKETAAERNRKIKRKEPRSSSLKTANDKSIYKNKTGIGGDLQRALQEEDGHLRQC